MLKNKEVQNMKALLKSFIILFLFILSSISVFAADNNMLAEKPLEGTEAFLSLALVLFIIIAPAFKRRERTTFLSSNNEFFTI